MYDPSVHHRRSIRLKSFDYRTPGAYVVTICTQHWRCLLASVDENEAHLSSAGRMVLDVWYELPHHFADLELDAFVVMPNHVHGIVVLCPSDDQRLEQSSASLPDVVQRFKSLTTHLYGQGVRNDGWAPYPGRLWHRNYFERIIRNERELEAFRQYIENNPVAWEKDRHYPGNQ